MLLSSALLKGEELVEHARSSGFPLTSVAGSMRRMRETVGDVDLLVGTDRPAEAMEAFVSFPQVVGIIVRGDSKTSVRLADGTQADMRAVPEASYGAALHQFRQLLSAGGDLPLQRPTPRQCRLCPLRLRLCSRGRR